MTIIVVGTDDYIYSIIITITVGSLDNGLPSSASACSRVHKAQESKSINSNPSHSSTSLIVYGIDVYDSDIQPWHLKQWSMIQLRILYKSPAPREGAGDLVGKVVSFDGK